MMRRILILIAGYFTLAAAQTTAVSAQNSQVQYGKCGYYADAQHGRKTASGEPYDKTQLTCAHKTLPFGTRIRVTRLDNGRSVVVRVNDRGPFIDGYVTDISRKAAETIGLLRDGVTKVKIEVVEGATTAQPVTYSTTTKTLPKSLEPTTKATTVRASSASEAKAQLLRAQQKTAAVPATSVAPITYSTSATTQPVPAATTSSKNVSELYQITLNPVMGRGFGVQLAVITSTENLFQEIAKLQATWPGKVVINHEEQYGVASFKLILGPFPTRKEAETQQKKAASKGYKKTFVVEFE